MWGSFYTPQLILCTQHNPNTRMKQGPKQNRIDISHQHEQISKHNSLIFWVLYFYYVFIFVFLGLHPQHIEIPRIGVQSELLLAGYTRAAEMPEPSCVCNLCQSSWQLLIPNPLSKATDQTCKLMVPSQICFHCTTMGIPWMFYF